MLERSRSPRLATVTWSRAPVPERSASGGWELRAGSPIAPRRTIVRRLGGGAEHEVFLADDAAFGRCVAKLARPHVIARGDACDALVREATALTRLAGPGIVRCLDVVLTGRHPHLLLEYVHGPTLRQLLRAGRAPAPPELTAIGESLARNLAAIAQRGWVHLDVKPENIVATPRPWLLDFGIACRIADAARLDAAVGTLAFMAPEQRACGGQRPHPPVGPPADVYGLAATLHEALAAGSDRSSGLAPVLLAALDPDPGRRPTAAEFATRLRWHVGAGPGRSGRTAPARRPGHGP